MRPKKTTENIFFSLAVLNIFIMYAILLISKGKFVLALTYDESNFCDFWSHINRLLFCNNIYTTDADAIFPPLAYLFLNLFAYPLSFKANTGDDLYTISHSGYGTLLVVMYILLFAWLFMISVHISYKTGTTLKKSALAGILMFSYSIWGFAFERGNMVLFTMIFLMLGLTLRDSANKVMREAGLIFLAISAGFKLYPALFGFVWIAEKRYKEAARLILYGLTCFFLPFLFVDSFKNYLHTFTQYLNKKIYSHASIWGFVFHTFGDNKYTQILCKCLVIVIILWALFLLFADGVNWKTITLLMATQTTIIPEQYVYTYVYIIIPLIHFLNESDHRKSDYIYAVLFACLFTMPPIWGGRGRLMVWIWAIILVMISADEALFLIKKGHKSVQKENDSLI